MISSKIVGFVLLAILVGSVLLSILILMVQWVRSESDKPTPAPKVSTVLYYQSQAGFELVYHPVTLLGLSAEAEV